MSVAIHGLVPTGSMPAHEANCESNVHFLHSTLDAEEACDSDRTPPAPRKRLVRVAGVEQGEETAIRAMQPIPALPDLALLHALMGHYARLLIDIQKTRVAMGNRVSAMERDGLDPRWQGPAAAAVAQLEAAEKGLNRELEKLARKHPLRTWIEAAPGIGLPGFARLLGITGPLDRFATVSKLWAYLGLSVVDGASPRKRKGELLHFSPQGRTLCYLFGESIVRVGKGKYREAYDAKKAQYEAERPDWTQAHRHEAAKRYAVKLLLKDLWIEWRRVVWD